MENYEIKTVKFMGDDLIAARDNGGKIWVGIRWMCEGIGLSKNQCDRQIRNINADRVLSKGAANLPLPTNGGEQNVLCLHLEYVPLWLAKINITPDMEKTTPELADKLEQYQLKAKDVLAAAFLPQPTALAPKSDAEMFLMQGQINVQFEQRMNKQDENFNEFKTYTQKQIDTVNTRIDTIQTVFYRPISESTWKVDMNEAINSMSRSIQLRGRLYQELETRAGVNLTSRLTRARNRMIANGSTKTNANKTNKLDVIAMDKQLREIFELIVCEYQIAYAMRAKEEADKQDDYVIEVVS